MKKKQMRDTGETDENIKKISKLTAELCKFMSEKQFDVYEGSIAMISLGVDMLNEYYNGEGDAAFLRAISTMRLLNKAQDDEPTDPTLN